MKKLNKVASLFATAALATSMSGAFAQTVDNWVNGIGNLPWKNGTNELCWRDGYWTPATAIAECDGALKPQHQRLSQRRQHQPLRRHLPPLLLLLSFRLPRPKRSRSLLMRSSTSTSRC